MTLDVDLSTFGRTVLEPLGETVARYRPRLSVREVGRVVEVGRETCRVAGLSGVVDSELIALPGGLMGIAANIARGGCGLILLGDGASLDVGNAAHRTGRAIDVPVGQALLGRVVDALGRPLDERGRIAANARWPIERPAPAIMARGPVKRPLETGIKAVDAAIPIGRGQRELILGDRQTGKTAIGIGTILNQRASGVISIYCAIGQRGAAVARVIAELKANDAMDNTIVVVAGGDDAPGLQFVAPYAATAMAEFFMEQGRDVLVIYDDLTRHARAYRELSLLLRRPPGREAYPGDIFFIHSRLLERSTQLRAERGGGSLTALPVIETQAQNISAYIPTNLISITDGQLYLSPDLFQKGQLPAIDIGRSVSRVGGKAQFPAFRSVAGDLKLSYAQFEELEVFARFGARLDDDTRQRLRRGRRVREVLRQGLAAPLGAAEQLAVLLAATQGLLDDVAAEDVGAAEPPLAAAALEALPDLGTRIASGERLDEDALARLLTAMRAVLETRPTDGNAHD